MKILVIPDVHLKPWMFEEAAAIMRKGTAEKAVSLGDLPDDWGCQNIPGIYKETFDAAKKFKEEFPDTLWCIGNHDVSYIWDYAESGMAYGLAKIAAKEGILSLWTSIPDQNLAYVHRIDNVLFSHGGVSKQFVQEYVPEEERDNSDKVIAAINSMTGQQLWQDNSPIWLRPRYLYDDFYTPMYKPDQFFQVTGHTPKQTIIQEENVLSCDVFSTYPDGTPFGTQEFCLIDTETWQWKPVACQVPD